MVSGNRRGRSQEPCFVFHLRKDYPYVSVPAGFVDPPECFRSRFRRTVVVCVHQDQDAAFRSRLSGRQFDSSLQLPGLENPVTRDSDRGCGSQDGVRRHTFSDPPEQDRDGFDFAVPFDNGRYRRHGSGLGAEQLDLLWRNVRELRVR